MDVLEYIDENDILYPFISRLDKCEEFISSHITKVDYNHIIDNNMKIIEQKTPVAGFIVPISSEIYYHTMAELIWLFINCYDNEETITALDKLREIHSLNLTKAPADVKAQVKAKNKAKTKTKAKAKKEKALKETESNIIPGAKLLLNFNLKPPKN